MGRPLSRHSSMPRTLGCPLFQLPRGAEATLLKEVRRTGFLSSLDPDPAQQLSVYSDDYRTSRHEDGSDSGSENHTGPCQRTRRQWDSEDIVAGGPPEVLQHLPIASAAEADDPRHVAWIASNKDNVTCLDSDIGASTNRDSNICRHKRWSVVDAVSDHRHRLALALQFLDLGRFVLREDLSEDSVDPEFPSDRVRHCLRVAGQHRHLDALRVQSLDRLGGFGTNGVGDCEGSQ